jgi:L-ornithine Nalpha-acyltransferase
MALPFASMPKGGGAGGFLQRFGSKRDLAGLGPVPFRSGALEARLAATREEVRRAQRLRYRVFFEERGAVANHAQRLTCRDVCRFDGVSDHLIVVDWAWRTRGLPALHW